MENKKRMDASTNQKIRYKNQKKLLNEQMFGEYVKLCKKLEIEPKVSLENNSHISRNKFIIKCFMSLLSSDMKI